MSLLTAYDDLKDNLSRTYTDRRAARASTVAHVLIIVFAIVAGQILYTLSTNPAAFFADPVLAGSEVILLMALLGFTWYYAKRANAAQNLADQQSAEDARLVREAKARHRANQRKKGKRGRK